MPQEGPSTSSTSAGTGTGTSEGGETSSESGEDTLALTSGATTTSTADASTGIVDDSTSSSTGAPLHDPDLVLWLTFDNPERPFADASAYARTVVCDAAGAACPEAAVPGPLSNAAVFDGTDDVLEIPHDPDLETDTGLTVALFVRNDLLSALAIRIVIARPYGAATENSWELFFRDQNADGETTSCSRSPTATASSD